MDTETILSGLVRIGTVTDTDSSKRMVRILYKDFDMTSGWLKVLKTDSSWMPKVNDVVVALYLPVFNGDGFIIGGL